MTARLALALALVLAAHAAPAAGQVPADAVVVVLPFESPQIDPGETWRRPGVAALVTDVLQAAGRTVVGRAERDRAFERLQLPLTATLSRASAIKVGQAVGATAVVVGRVDRAGGDLVLAARVVRLDSGRLLPEAQARGAERQLFDLAAAVAREAFGLSSAAQWVAPPSLAAFELYTRGLSAETPAAQQSLLEQALEAAPAYDAVRMALWQLHTDQGAHQRAYDRVASLTEASALYREGRFAAAMSLLALGREDEAFKVLRALQDRTPSAAVANALGVVQLRRGSPQQTGRATYYFNLATEIDPADADYFFNLGYAYWVDGDANGAAYWLREAVRRDPADGDAHFVLSVALGQMGAPTEAARERELALRLSSQYVAWEARAAAGGDLVPRGLERLHDRLVAPSARVDLILTASGQRDQAELAAFHLEAGRRALEREADREAAAELRRALFLSPYLAEAHLLLGRVHLRGGRPEDAIRAFKIAIWSEEHAAHHVALAEAHLALDEVAEARAAVARALMLDPASAEARALQARLPAPR